MNSTRPVEWKKRARRLRLTGALVLVAAVLLVISANLVGGLLVGLLGVGNVLAGGHVARTGEVPKQVRTMIVVGGVGFVVVMVAGSVLALLRG